MCHELTPQLTLFPPQKLSHLPPTFIPTALPAMEAPVCRSRLEINFIRLLDETQQMANGSKPKDWTFEKVGDRAGPLCHVLKLASYHNTT